MHFPHTDPERLRLHSDAQRAIDSHGKPIDMLDPRTREIVEDEHTGIELTRKELLMVKSLVFDKIETIKNEMAALERSLDEGTAPNPDDAEARLVKLEQELNAWRHNFAEKIFGETGSVDEANTQP